MEKAISVTGNNGTFTGRVEIIKESNTINAYIGEELFTTRVMDDEDEVCKRSDIIEQILKDELKVLADGPAEVSNFETKMRLKGYNDKVADEEK